jgi:cbb3-type cytochrome oxidase maturation protein
VSILYVLIPLGLIILSIAVAAFFWATRSGQFDDLETPAWSVVMDDDRKPRAGTDAPADRTAEPGPRDREP